MLVARRRYCLVHDPNALSNIMLYNKSLTSKHYESILKNMLLVLCYRSYDITTMLISPSDVSKSEPLHFLVALVSRSNKLELICLFTSRKSTSIVSKWKLIASITSTSTRIHRWAPSIRGHEHTADANPRLPFR